MEKIRPLHATHPQTTTLYHPTSGSSQDIEPELEMETNTNELEKVVSDLAHSIRMNGIVCKFQSRNF